MYYRRCLTVIYKKQASKKLIREVLNNKEVGVRSVEMRSGWGDDSNTRAVSAQVRQVCSLGRPGTPCSLPWCL